jgi:hypothetical protein
MKDASHTGSTSGGFRAVAEVVAPGDPAVSMVDDDCDRDRFSVRPA